MQRVDCELIFSFPIGPGGCFDPDCSRRNLRMTANVGRDTLDEAIRRVRDLDVSLPEQLWTLAATAVDRPVTRPQSNDDFRHARRDALISANGAKRSPSRCIQSWPRGLAWGFYAVRPIPVTRLKHSSGPATSLTASAARAPDHRLLWPYTSSPATEMRVWDGMVLDDGFGA